MSEDLMDIDWVLSEIKIMMDDMGLNLSVAESLTAGKLQDLFVKQSGASSYFEGGITAYNINQKVHFLGVDRDHAEKCNCVSQETADEMAKGVANSFVSDYGISTTGYAESYEEGESGSSYAHISIYNMAEGSVDRGFLGGISGDRGHVRNNVAETAIRMFYIALLQKKQKSSK